LAGGCSSQPPAPDGSSLSFEYQGRGPSGTIDQTLAIGNDSDVTLAPVLRLTALDADGRPMPGVTVTTVYGSDRGEVAVPAEGALDILRFAPEERIGEVVDVRAEVDSTSPTSAEGGEPVEVSVLSGDGQESSKELPFAALSLDNPNPEAARVRVVHLVYDDPPPGRSQQVVSVILLAGPVEVPAGGPLVVSLDEATVRAVADAPSGAVSVKAFLTS
jgi:hypothetical protein